MSLRDRPGPGVQGFPILFIATAESIYVDNYHHGKSLSESGQLKHHNLEIMEALVAAISAGINSKSSTAPLGCLLQILVVLLQEGGPLPGPKTGLLSNIQK